MGTLQISSLKLNFILHDLIIPLLDIYVKKTKKALILIDMYTTMLTAAFFLVVKIWKQPKCPSKRCGDHYSAIKKKCSPVFRRLRIQHCYCCVSGLLLRLDVYCCYCCVTAVMWFWSLAPEPLHAIISAKKNVHIYIYLFILPFSKTWMDLEGIIPIYCQFTLFLSDRKQ